MNEITVGCLTITHLMISPEVITVYLNCRVNSYQKKKKKKKLWTENNILEPVRCFSGENHYLK